MIVFGHTAFEALLLKVADFLEIIPEALAAARLQEWEIRADGSLDWFLLNDHVLFHLICLFIYIINSI